ncbi:hypothetical protein [Nocardioides sp. YIM 152588]|uniref:hypothetical protein n=1 Tax=Nocardioides sp. YIM 152588 TaxID=3158259 RepID=UPI0032E40F61
MQGTLSGSGLLHAGAPAYSTESDGPAMKDKTPADSSADSSAHSSAHSSAGPGADARQSRALAVARFRSAVARVVWSACLVIALVLACAAFSYAFDANGDNALVRTVRDLADVFDLGLFDLGNPVWASADPDRDEALVKTALANYGAAALAYLVVGRVLERLIRP